MQWSGKKPSELLVSGIRIRRPGIQQQLTVGTSHAHSHAAMRYVGSPCIWHAGRWRMRTSEPRDRASWTLAASVHQADIDYDAWSSRRGNPHAYPPLGTPLMMTVRLVADIQNRLFLRVALVGF